MVENFIDSYTGCGATVSFEKNYYPGCDVSCNGEIGTGCACRGNDVTEEKYETKLGDLYNE